MEVLPHRVAEPQSCPSEPHPGVQAVWLLIASPCVHSDVYSMQCFIRSTAHAQRQSDWSFGFSPEPRVLRDIDLKIGWKNRRGPLLGNT